MLLQFHRARDAGDPHAFRFEPQDYLLSNAGGSAESARFEWTREVLEELQALRLPGRDAAVVQRMGERLRRFVRDAGWAQHEQEIAQALAHRRPVLVSVRSSAAELYALPWELLTLRSGQFLGELDGVLLRFEWPESRSAEEQPQPRAEGGRILIAWSAAAGAVPAAEHVRAIAAACATGVHPFDPEADVLAHASLERIVQTLREAELGGAPIAVLHLLCHGAAIGGTFGLALNGASGPALIDAAQLRQQLAPFAQQVRLVVLSACDSGNLGTLGNQLGSVAQALHRCGFQAVLASRFPLSSAGSVALTESLYASLLGGPESLETALLFARKQLALNETRLPAERRPLDWASLQLYARQEDGDDTRPVIFRPYRGLLAFQPEHRRFFFGRDPEVRELLSDLQALIGQKKERFLVVAGASGTGKSSLVLAGAVPGLLQADPRLVLLRMRPGADPEAALDSALSACPAGSAALLIVDQFEEIFTQTERPAARAAFVQRLWSLAAAPEPGLRVLITLRVDFIGRCGELLLDGAGLRLDRIVYDEAHRLFVAQLQPEQLRAAIVEPARRVGLHLMPGLAERMLDEVGREPGALPLLEDALDVLWQHREGRVLTQRAYDALGGVIGALQKRADALLDRLPAQEDLLIAQRLLVSLVAVAEDTALDTRLRVPLSELRGRVGAEQAAGLDRILGNLVAARLLVQSEDGREPMVEVAHEALIRKWPRLRAWLDEDRAGLLMQHRIKRAAQEWDAQQHDPSLLYRGTQLAQAEDWRKTRESRLGSVERQFLDASREKLAQEEAEEAERLRRERAIEERLAEERRQKEKQKLESMQALTRRTRIAAGVLGVSFIGAAAFGVQALRKSIEARDNQLLAVAQLNKEDPTRAAILLREVEQKYSPIWIQAAVDALHGGVAESVLREHQAGVTAVAFSPDGKKLATVSIDGVLRIYDTAGSDPPVLHVNSARSPVLSLSFSPDGKKIVTGSEDRIARVWKVDEPGDPIELKGHSTHVSAVAFRRDGRKIATADEKAVRLFNADGSGAPLVLLRGDEGAIRSLAFSPDGKELAGGSVEQSVHVWDADGAGPPRVLKGFTAAIWSVAFSPDGQQIAAGQHDGATRIQRLDDQGDPLVLRSDDSIIRSVVFSPDGKSLATASHDRSARIWNLETGDPFVLKGHEDLVLSVAFSPDGKKLATGSADSSARIWNIDELRAPLVLKGHTGSVLSVAFSPDGKRLVSSANDKTARIWSADGSGPPVILKDPEFVSAAAWSPDGRKLATASGDKTARIWNADGSGAPRVLTGHADSLFAVAFSPDGKRLATGSSDGTARIWNVDGSGSPVVLTGHASTVLGVAFRPDGKALATASVDHTARIWNTDGGTAAQRLHHHTDSLVGITFSPDGKQLVTGAEDGTARILSLDGSGAPVVFHTPGLSSIALSADGKRIAFGAKDGSLNIWNTSGPGPSLVLRGHESAIQTLAFNSDGTMLVSGTERGIVRVWPIGSELLRAALWRATRDCLPPYTRRLLLQESTGDSTAGSSRCEQRVRELRTKKP